MQMPNQWDVLVVDDEPDSLDLITTILKYHGIACFGANSAEAAIAYLADHVPTLILIDLLLPNTDGWGFFGQIGQMQHLADVPRVAMTAYHTPMVAAKAIHAGFDAFFPKPIDAMTFVQDIGGIIAEKYRRSA
jgi:CheY-like chemotaxis protein